MTKFAKDFELMSAGMSSDNKSNQVDLSGLDSDLRTRLEKLQEIYKRDTGKDLPLTSGVRTYAQQKDLFERYKKGEKGINMPINPDEVKKDLYHTDAVDISASVPDKYLEQVGLHRPLGSKDPFHVTINPKSEFQPEVSTKYAKDFDLISQAPPEKNGETTKPVQKTEPPSRAESIAMGAAHGFGSLALGGQQLIGKGLEAVGAEKAGNALVQDALEGIKKINAEIAPYEKSRPYMTGTGKVLGTVAGVAPTGVGAIGEGASLASKLVQSAKGGAFVGALEPVTDIKNYAEEKAKQIGFGGAGGVVGYPIGAGIARGVGAVGNAGMDLARAFTNKLMGKVPDQVIAEAAGKANLSPQAHIDLQSATPQVQKQFVSDINRGHIPNEEGIKNQAAANRLGTHLLPGMATRDPGIWSNEQNAIGTNPDVRNHIASISKKLVENLDTLHKNASGEYANISDEFGLGKKHIEKISEQIKNNRKEINQAYTDLEALNGGKFPVDGKLWAENVIAKLNESDRLDYLKEKSPIIYKKLMEYAEGKKEMNMNLFKNLAGEIADEQRAAEGTTKRVLGIARSELENLPMSVENLPVKEARDKAISLAKTEFNREETIPAYNSVSAKVSKSKGAAEPEDFVRKHIIGGSLEEMQALANEVKDPSYRNLMKATLTNRLKEKGITIGGDDLAHKTFTSQLEDPFIAPKLGEFLTDAEKQHLADIQLTSHNAKVGPVGEYKNYSKTDIANAARQGVGLAGQAVNFITQSPVGSVLSNLAAPEVSSKVEQMTANEMLKPGAGMALPTVSATKSLLRDIGRYGGAKEASDYVTRIELSNMLPDRP
jgi:hypothetical protein